MKTMELKINALARLCTAEKESDREAARAEILRLMQPGAALSADPEYLIRQMMLWFGVSEQRLEREGEIDTPIDVLSWKYWQYVKANPIREWKLPTGILYAGKDDLQSREVVDRFAAAHGCRVTVSENSRHPFMEEADIPVVENWLRETILGDEI